MTPRIATALFIIGIAGLFVLNRGRKAQTSKALWIPVVWLSIATSRAVSQWLAAFGISSGPSFKSPDQYLEGSPLDRNVFIALLVLGMIVLIVRSRRVAPLLRANWPILLFIFYSAVSVAWSDYPDVAFKRWIKALGDVVMVMIVLTDSDRISAIKRLLARVGFVMVPVSVLFIKYYPDLGRTYNRFQWTPSFTGVTTFKNLLGMTCLIVGIGAVWCFLRALHGVDGKRTAGILIAQCALLLMVLWLFWIANSMTSLSCFLMATCLMVATSLRAVVRRPWLVHVLVVAILFASFSALFLNSGGDILQTMGRDSTLTGRTEIWHLVLGMAANPIVGTGFESFWLGDRLQKIWNIYWWHPNEAHDGYLEIYLNLGWVGVALLAIILARGYRNVIKAFRLDPEVGRLTLAFFVVGVAYNFTESAIRTLNPIWITLLLAVMALPSGPAVEDAPSPSVTETPVRIGQHAGESVAVLHRVRV